MRALVQRVSRARVLVEGEVTGEIRRGLLVFVGVHRNDSSEEIQSMARKVLQLRIFPDSGGKMNLSVQDICGDVLVVSQFTLYGETRRGNRPSYSEAADPQKAKELYQEFIQRCRDTGLPIAAGVFQAQMQVELVNDGPVTLWCEIESR